MASMQQQGQRVLVVEDDPSIARLLEIELGEAGYRVELARTGAQGLAAIEGDEPDLVVLDVRLPDVDGLTVCRSARRGGHNVPILMLTALDRVGDRVLGLDTGADDYLSKPFAIEAAPRPAARPCPPYPGGRRVAAGRRRPPQRRQPRGDRRERPVELSAREFDLLAFLMHAPGRVFTREQIYEGVWGVTYPGRTKVIDFFVSALRRKLDLTAKDSLIRTVRGVGYTIRA